MILTGFHVIRNINFEENKNVSLGYFLNLFSVISQFTNKSYSDGWFTLWLVWVLK